MKIAKVILMSLAISTFGAVALSRYHAEQAEISVPCSRSTESNFGGVSDTDIAAATAGRESVYSRVPSGATVAEAESLGCPVERW
ncbi:hypothetical protein [Tardiphaga sp.]|uniref:hypothetical protein n=1 Tax=Tardiphaga sp. TaxID=1926292 RepID=UPI0026283011|nr:hypothetical protein [Tardiphaga sp.]MDB5617831.1 hypothetical protein [Tardiphaga sp.]